MTLYFISHFIQVWLFPPGLNLSTSLLGFFLWRHWPLLGKTLIAIAFVSLWLLSTPIVAWHLINGLQRQYAPLHLDQLTKQNIASAIVVLSGGDITAPDYEDEPMVSFNSLSRLHYSVYLYQKTQLPIIVSGGSANISLPAAADLMIQTLRQSFKVPTEWKEDKSINTADEGKFLVPLLKQHKIKTIYLVTNAWHMPRSMAIFNLAFKPVGLKIIPAPMGYIGKGDAYLPSLGALNTSVIAMHEYVGIGWYHIFYGSSSL